MKERERTKLGPTGRFPDGKIRPDDLGELQLHVGHDKDKGLVVVEFGTPVTWLAMPPMKALALAESLRKHAKRARRTE